MLIESRKYCNKKFNLLKLTSKHEKPFTTGASMNDSVHVTLHVSANNPKRTIEPKLLL